MQHGPRPFCLCRGMLLALEGSMVVTPKSWGSRGQDRAEGPCPSQPQSEGSGTRGMAVRDRGTTRCRLLSASTSQTPVP